MDLITSPAYVVIKAANEFKDKTTAINQLWQTDFTYLSDCRGDIAKSALPLAPRAAPPVLCLI